MMTVPKSASEISEEWSSNYNDGMLHIHTPAVESVVDVPRQKYDVVVLSAGERPCATYENVLIRLDCLPIVIFEFDNGGKVICREYDTIDVTPHEGE